MYEEEIRRYCSYKGLEVGRLYSDIDYSAFRGSRPRPALQQLVKERASYSTIVIPKLSRFGRSMQELIRLFDLFDRDGIPLVFLDMKLDTSTSQGRLLRHILAAFAEYESDVKADYCRANYMRRKMEGKPWGSAPFGYVGGGDWRPDEKAAPILRSIFTRYADGMSASRIALELNMAGVPTVKAKHWSGSRIAKILDNPVYAGLLIYDDSLVKGTWEPLVEQALWDHVRARRNADPRRRAHLGQAPRPSTYLLSGLLWCGQCGRKMNHSKGRRRGTVYVCSGDAWSSWVEPLSIGVGSRS
jgi:site-specific DNA recombinase